ncbi:hypothetical protein ACFU8R_28340 [Pseudonocardia alni]|uniref:Uncharacterized protein n=1 Tax=Pseudonocardia tropica TaxID=681289 RepID=A0ABV1K222_9PSEU
MTGAGAIDRLVDLVAQPDLQLVALTTGLAALAGPLSGQVVWVIAVLLVLASVLPGHSAGPVDGHGSSGGGGAGDGGGGGGGGIRPFGPRSPSPTGARRR